MVVDVTPELEEGVLVNGYSTDVLVTLEPLIGADGYLASEGANEEEEEVSEKWETALTSPGVVPWKPV